MRILVNIRSRSRVLVADGYGEDEHFLSFRPIGRIVEDPACFRNFMSHEGPEVDVLMMIPYGEIESILLFDDAEFAQRYPDAEAGS